MGILRIGIAAMATLVVAGTAIAADSTSVQEVDVPWKPPSYAATSGSANTAGYANAAGNGVSGINGSSLNLSNGTSYSLPSGGGGGGGGGCPNPQYYQPEGGPSYFIGC